MIKQRSKIFVFFLYLGDLGGTLLAFSCAYWLRGILHLRTLPPLFPFSLYSKLLLAIIPIWSVVFYVIDLYRFQPGQKFWREIWGIFKAVSISSLLLGFTVFVLKYQFVSRILLFSFVFFDFLFIIVIRFIIRDRIYFFNRKSENYRFLLIVGTDKSALNLARSIEKYKDLGLRILGFLATGKGNPPQKLNSYPLLGLAGDLPTLLEKEVVDEVIFSVPQEELKGMEELFLLCEERGITTRIVLNFFPHVIAKTHLEELEGIPLLTFATTPKNELLLSLRRVFDILGSLILIILLSPLFFLITILIRLDSPGPAIYRQTRCGLNGRKFMLKKFRSMVLGAEGKQRELIVNNIMSGPVFKMKNDPRVTRVGRFLRKASLDELPQLFNVLRGDMSLVGPRPPMPEEVEKYEGWQRRKLSMKPGMTGLWQVSGRNQIDFNDWMKLDLEYIDHWSLWLDLKILLKTIPVVLFGKGAI